MNEEYFLRVIVNWKNPESQYLQVVKSQEVRLTPVQCLPPPEPSGGPRSPLSLLLPEAAVQSTGSSGGSAVLCLRVSLGF